MHKQQANGIQGKPKSELWIPIAYAIFYFPTFEWLNAHNFPRYYIGCKLDDLIPFCEWFVIPYMIWFVFVFFSIFYTALYEKEVFVKTMKYVAFTYTFALIVFVVYPNCQEPGIS